MSETFCSLPWNHLATHPHGVCTLCCESEQHQGMSQAFNGDEGLTRKLVTLQNVDDFAEITNSDSFSKVRLAMLQGQKPKECRKCWDLESAGMKSKRYYENRRVPMDIDHAMSITNKDGTLKEVNYEFVELRLGNHCNVQCRTCNPYSSSRWLKDWDTIYPERPSLPEMLTQKNFNWPLDQGFWDKLITRCDKLKVLYINGGEPFIVDKHMDFLATLVERDLAKNVQIVYSTNCTTINKNFEDVWKNFKHIQFMLSIDCVGDRNEYIRTFTKWPKVLSFLDWMMSMSARYKNIDYNILQTVSTYNVYYIPEFYDFFKDKVPLVGHPAEDDSLHISHNFVTDPEHFDCRILPQEVQDIIVKRLEGYQGYNDIKNYFDGGEGQWGSYQKSNMETFFQKTRALDASTNKKFEEYFPELYELIKKYE